MGLRLQRFRKSAGLSQAELAQELAERGLPFQQPTILKVEKGTRPLKVDEAVIIAEILNLPVADLIRDARLETGQELLRARAERERSEQLYSEAKNLYEAAMTREWEAQDRFHTAEVEERNGQR